MIGMSKWLPHLNLVVFYYFLTYPSVGERSEIVKTLFPPLMFMLQKIEGHDFYCHLYSRLFVFNPFFFLNGQSGT